MSEKQNSPKVVNKSCGIDFGTSCIAVAVTFSDNPLGAQLVGNLLANETTPGVVKIFRDVITIGEDAVATATICPQNVFSHIPLILYYSERLEEMKNKYPDLSFSIEKKEDGELYFGVIDDSMFTEISLTQVVTMLFKYIRKIVSIKYPENLNNTVVSLPADLPSTSIRVVMDAAHLAGFENIQFVSTTTAQAYHYSLRLKNASEIPEEGERNILFVDQGSCFTSLYVVRATNTESSIVYSTEKQLGAKDVDHYLYDYFVNELKGKVEIQPFSKRAIRLMNGCSRLKTMLSAASKAVYTVDGLLDGDDYQLQLTRAQFDNILHSHIQEFEAMVKKVKSEFTGTLDAVEMIGGGSRMTFMQTVVKDVIGLPLRFTVDSASCIAKGCALFGMYGDVQSVLPMKEPFFLPAADENKENYEKNKEIYEKIAERTAKQEAKSEIINRFESLISQMRRELNGEFGEKLNREVMEPLLDTEDDWLMQAEDEEIQVITDRYNQFEETLKSTFKEYYEAKEAKHKEIELQLEEESKKRVDDDKEDVKLPYKTRLSRVEVNKKEGNDLFKDKNYSMAVQRYMRALGHCTKFFDLSPEQKEVVADLEKSLRLNLAQCFIKLEGWEKAIEHCTNVLQKDPKNTKALYRRAFCYDKLKDVEKCTADLKVVMTLIPEDASVKNLYNRNELNRKRLQEKRKAMAKRMFGN